MKTRCPKVALSATGAAPPAQSTPASAFSQGRHTNAPAMKWLGIAEPLWTDEASGLAVIASPPGETRTKLVRSSNSRVPHARAEHPAPRS